MAGAGVRSSAQLTELSGQLVECARRIMEPSCPPEQRQKYQKTIDDFKETSPYCVECSLLLMKQSDSLLQHLGLQLLNHFIRYRWISLQGDDQTELRRHILTIIAEVGCYSNRPPGYVLESMARIVVEVIKRTWPQFWPTLQEDLQAIGQQPLHIELLLTVYRRLVEDLLSYDSTLSQQRRADMLSELQTSLLPSVIALILEVMQSGQEQLQQVAMEALLPLSEWIDLSYVTADNCRCLVLLYSLTSSLTLRSTACDCLIELLSRKGDLKQTRDHRLQFLKLYSSEAISIIQTAAVGASQCEDEESYQFVKKACRVLMQLGVAQLAPLWDTDQFKPPDNLVGYLTVMLEFTKHPSQVLCQHALDVWSSFTVHPFVSSNGVFLSCVPSLLTVLRTRQLKVGDPTSDAHQSSFYSRMDFDGQLEHGIFFSRFKGVVNRILTATIRLCPAAGNHEAFNTAQILAQPHTGADCASLLLEWDGFVSYIECWTQALGNDVTLPIVKEATPTGVSIIQLLLDHTPQDPLTAAAHLRALHGGLVMFVTLQDQLLQKYLEKVLTYAVYTGGVPKDMFSLTRDERQVRLTALYCLNSVIKNHAAAVLPASRHLFDHYQSLVSKDQLLYNEKGYFIEAFVLLSHFGSEEEQVELLKQLLSEVVTLCDSSMISAVTSLELFVPYLGLHIDPTNAEYSRCSLHRARLCHCVHVTMGVLQKLTKREMTQCKAVPNPSLTTTSTPHPSFQCVIPLVVQLVLPLIKTLHLLWSSHSAPLLSEFFKGITSLHELEKKAIVGVSHHALGEEPGELNKVHHQLLSCYDFCVMAVGFAWVVYGPQSLAECGVIDSILHNVFEHLLDSLPLRIKPVLRNMIVLMVTSCPSNHWSSSLLPILTRIFYITFSYLQQSWDGILQRLSRSEQDNDDEQQALSQEVLEYQFIGDLTKQYSHILDVVCFLKADSDVMENDAMEDLSKPGATGGGNNVLSGLALCLLEDGVTRQLLHSSVFMSLTWRDSLSVRRCAAIAAAIIEKTAFDQDLFKQLLEQVLLSLQIHGADESIKPLLLGLALQLYEVMLPNCPQVVSLLADLPGCNQKRVLAFNNGVLSGKNKPHSVKPTKLAKWKRDEFKKLLSGIIGKPIGQLYRKPPPVLDLPDLVVKKARRKADKSTTDTPLNLSLLFSDQSS